MGKFEVGLIIVFAVSLIIGLVGCADRKQEEPEMARYEGTSNHINHSPEEFPKPRGEWVGGGEVKIRIMRDS